MLKENVKKAVSFVRDHRKELASVLGNIEWLQLTKGRIVVDEFALNDKYLPLFKEQMPEEVQHVDIRIREGYLEITAEVLVKGQRLKGQYHIWIDQFIFDPSKHQFVLSYRENFPFDNISLGKKMLFSTGKFLVQSITGRSLIGFALKDVDGIHFDGNKMVILLDEIPRFQQLKEKKFLGQSIVDRIRIKNISLENKKMTVEISILGWDEPLPPNNHSDYEILDGNTQLKEGEKIDENVVRIEEKHQRFYDKLRERIQVFIHDKGGSKAEKNAKYLLLAPDLFVLLARLLKDPRVPIKSKSIVAATVAYFISPVDIIPEFLTGPVGFMDDIVLAVFALKAIIVDVNPRILEQHWNGEQSVLQVIQDVIRKGDDLVGKKTVGLLKRVLKKR